MNEGQFKVIDDYLCIKMPKEIDHHNAEILSKRVDQYILSGKVNHIVFDFQDTKFMDSSGIGIIIGRYKKIALFGGKVFVVHADKQIKRILSVSGMGKLVEIME